MEKVISIEIDSSMDGHQIEYVLEKRLNISSSLIKRLKRTENGVMLNGEHKPVTTKVKKRDLLVVSIKGKESENIVPVDIPIDILWEDEDIIVLNKSGSMPVHPSKKHQKDTLANGVVHYLGSRETIHIITRLDRETSGVVLVAKNPQSAAILTTDMKNGKIEKEYVAIVNGCPDSLESIINAPIKKKDGKGIARCVAADGKESVTRYKVIRKSDMFSLVELVPITGRTHQLRVHMSHIGHSIYGDSMYGALQIGERTRLHCHKITFNHPILREKITITAKIPDDFCGIV